MKFWVGVTDKEWFDFSALRRPDEVNFWQPSSRPLARFLAPGTPFLFKLHSPLNFVVGGGFFVRFSALPARLAWEAFAEKNGVEDYTALRRRIDRYREGAVRGDPVIGCNILNAPFFLDRDSWISIPEDWSRNIVRGKGYDTVDTAGLRLWNEITARMSASPAIEPQAESAARYGAEYLAHARLGQGAFRVLVTEAYSRSCAITGEKTLPVLQAAHIKPYAQDGPHLVSNGLLLRADLHKLFDDGYVTVTDQLHVEVSRRIKEEFSNGREYYALHGRPLAALPDGLNERPSSEFLRWHNTNKYLG
jgi:putative restriction endonuclease